MALPATDMANLTGNDAAQTGLLQRARRIAVVGASTDVSRDSHRIFLYLRRHGYDALPVTPKPDPIDGVDPVPDLEAAKAHWGDEGIDIVDVFRRRDATPEVAQQAVAAGAKAIWFQFGTDHPDAVRTALDGGLDVVADRCIKVEHARLL